MKLCTGGIHRSTFTNTIPKHRASLKDNKIAVVCSARSTGKKVEGTTSR